MTAVESQYELCPIALTTLATHDGPVSRARTRDDRSSLASGITHDIAGSAPLVMSLKIVVSGDAMWPSVHSGP